MSDVLTPAEREILACLRDDKRASVAAAVEIIDRLVAEVERLRHQLDSARRHLPELDCRYTAAGVADASGNHCPIDQPCQRCEVERLRERNAKLEDVAAIARLVDAYRFQAFDQSQSAGDRLHNALAALEPKP